MELRTILDWQIAPRLRQVPGVIEVNANRRRAEDLRGAARPPIRCTRFGLSLAEVFDAISRNNGDPRRRYAGAQRRAGGDPRRGADRRPRGYRRAWCCGPAEGGTPLYVRDIAQVTQAPRPRHGAVTRDGRGEAVVGVALMLLGENTREVVERVKAAVEAIGHSLPPGVEIDALSTTAPT